MTNFFAGFLAAAQNLEANEDFVKFASDFMSNLSPAIYGEDSAPL
jgi:hypothetical protein